MIQRDSLARHTLDTLPFNIAVLDDEGTILFTNRAWKEFAGVGPNEQGELVGVNYFESMDTEGDEYAARALDGLGENLGQGLDVGTSSDLRNNTTKTSVLVHRRGNDIG